MLQKVSNRVEFNLKNYEAAFHCRPQSNLRRLVQKWTFARLRFPLCRFGYQFPDFDRNGTLFGLRTNAKLAVGHDRYQNRIETVSGIDVDASDIEPSEALVFNVPAYIAVVGHEQLPSSQVLPLNLRGGVWGLPWQNALVFKMLSREERERTRQAMLRKSEKSD